MYTQASSLVTTVANLRKGTTNLHTLIDQLCDRIERIEPQIASLMPEAERRARLHADADALLQRFPDAATRARLQAI